MSGLQHWGVGKAGTSATTRTNVLLNRAKEARHRESMKAPRVGSAPVVSADEWMATAEANQAIREREGAVGNPFADAETLIREGARQAKRQRVDDFFLLPESHGDDHRPSDHRPSRGRLPGLYWDDIRDNRYGRDEDSADDESVCDESDLRHLDDEPTASTVAKAAGTESPNTSANQPPPLSRQEQRDIEIAVVALYDRLEDEGLDQAQIDAKCDALRAELTTKRRAPTGVVIAFDDDDDPTEQAAV